MSIGERESTRPPDPVPDLLVPLQPGDLTPTWLTAALRDDPTLGGLPIDAVTVDALAESGVSRVYRLHIRWAGDGAAGLARAGHGVPSTPPSPPATLIAKLPAATAEGRAGPHARRMTRREQRFYDTLAPQTEIGVPSHYTLLGNDEAGRALLLEDVATRGFRTADAVVGLKPGEAGAVVESIARLHARWWQGPRLDALADCGWLYDYASRGLDIDIPDDIDDHWATLLATGVVPAGARAAGDRMAADLPALTERFLALPTTVIHGDLHLENVCLRVPHAAVDPRSPPVVAAPLGGATQRDAAQRDAAQSANPPSAANVIVIDWQHTARGPAAYDLAKILLTGVEARDLSRRGDRILARYRAALTASGVDYPAAALGRDLRLAALILTATDIGDGGASVAAKRDGRVSPWTRRLLANLAHLDFESRARD